MDNDYLQHYGVLGMKWGVRKSKVVPNKRSNRKNINKEYWSDDAKTVLRLNEKKMSQLSNAEIRKINERKQLEKQYAQLNPSHVKKGLAFIGAAAATMNTALNFYNNSDKLVKTGRSFINRIIKR